MVPEYINEIDAKIALMRGRLASLQNEDGGFRAFYCHDRESGMWTTATVVHSLSKLPPAGDDLGWLRRGCDYLVASQNADGGWPFRAAGKSITDITAWCCLALSHYGYDDAIRRGIEFILQARTECNGQEGADCPMGWGFTSHETPRTYSTWAACYCLSRLLRTRAELFRDPEAVEAAMASAKSWLLASRHEDGSWGATAGTPSSYSSTAMALLTLFLQGENPENYGSSYKYLCSGMHDHLWAAENEVVITQEKYELSQDWFTSAQCLAAMIFFAELNIAPIDQVHGVFSRLMKLVRADGNVAIEAQGAADFMWSIPQMVTAAEKYRALILSKQREFNDFLYRQEQQQVSLRKQSMQETLQVHFPYPVSQVFFSYQHELDYHRRFQLILQLYEVAIKYATIVGISGYLLGREQDGAINALLRENFRRPSLGDWSTLVEALLKSSAGFAKLLQPVSAQDVLRNRHSYLNESGAKTNLHQTIEAILTLRNNNTGHGALRTVYEYKQIVEQEEDRLYSFFDRLGFLATGNSFLVLASQYDEFGESDRYKIRVFRGLNISDNDLETPNRLSEGQKDTMVRYIYFQNTSNNTIVNLYPFLSYMYCDSCKREHFFFFNGIKGSERVTYLSYECGHFVERENMAHFRKRLQASGIEWSES
jgi:hypothetical protein